MEYRIEVNGETKMLPARTPEMDDRITMIQTIFGRVRSGEITRREARQEQYNFAADCTGGDLPPLEQMDVSDLEILVNEIINAYQRPAYDAKIEAAMQDLRKLTGRPEFKKLSYILSKGK